MEIAEEYHGRRDDDAKIAMPSREAGPVPIAVTRLSEAIDRLAMTERSLRDRLAPVLGPQRVDALAEVLKRDREEQAPLANDLDDLSGRIDDVYGNLAETIARLHL